MEDDPIEFTQPVPASAPPTPEPPTPPQDPEYPVDIAAPHEVGRDCRSTRWVFTLFCELPPRFTPDMAFLAYQRERCPRTGRLHWQCYVRFKGTKRWSTLHRIWPDGYIALARGNEQQCADYCSKEASRTPGSLPCQFGTIRPEAGRQGKRSDLDSIADDIKSGHRERQIAEKYPSDFIRYHSGIKRLVEVLSRPDVPEKRDVRMYCIWGPTGTGKTHLARCTWPGAFWAEPGRAPFDTYDNQPVLVIDEFNDTAWDLSLMLKVMDVWRLELNCRYNNKVAAWAVVVLILNQNPKHLYSMNPPSTLNAFRRRIGPAYYKTTREQTLDFCTRIPDFSPESGIAITLDPPDMT